MNRLRAPEIKQIITEQLGIKTLADYQKYLTTVPKQVTVEDIELLSPDRVNCIEFWQVIDELFGTDPVCNEVVPQLNPLYNNYKVDGVMTANRINLHIARCFGILYYLEEHKSKQCRTIEIGAGYGSLKNWIESNTMHEYIGFDVVCRIPGIHQLTEEGLFARNIERYYGTANYVVSTNVFQHLSNRQREVYFTDAWSLLGDGGLFIFNMFVDDGRASPEHPMRLPDGSLWCIRHYGQFTTAEKIADIEQKLKRIGFRIYMTTKRFDSVTTFVAEKRTR